MCQTYKPYLCEKLVTMFSIWRNYLKCQISKKFRSFCLFCSTSHSYVLFKKCLKDYCLHYCCFESLFCPEDGGSNSFEISMTVYQTTRLCSKAGDRNPHSYQHHRNLKAHKHLTFNICRKMGYIKAFLNALFDKRTRLKTLKCKCFIVSRNKQAETKSQV
jgi:hypothetical protein